MMNKARAFAILFLTFYYFTPLIFALAPSSGFSNTSSYFWKLPEIQSIDQALRQEGKESFLFQQGANGLLLSKTHHISIRPVPKTDSYLPLLKYIYENHPKGFLPVFYDSKEDQYYILSEASLRTAQLESYDLFIKRAFIIDSDQQIKNILSVVKRFGLLNQSTSNYFSVQKDGQEIIFDPYNLLRHRFEMVDTFEFSDFQFDGPLHPIKFHGNTDRRLFVLKEFSTKRNIVYMVKDLETEEIMILKFSQEAALRNEAEKLGKMGELIDIVYDRPNNFTAILTPIRKGIRLDFNPIFTELRKKIRTHKVIPVDIKASQPSAPTHILLDETLDEPAVEHTMPSANKPVSKAINHSIKEVLQELSKYEENQAIEIAKILIKKIAELHKNGIVHGDIKPANLICETQKNTDSKIVAIDAHIIDLEIAFLEEDPENILKLDGTPSFFAPEMYSLYDTQFIHNNRGSYARDWYALGKALMIMLTGITPGFSYPDLDFDSIKQGFGPHISNDMFLDVTSELDQTRPLFQLLRALAEHDPNMRMKMLQDWMSQHMPELNLDQNLTSAA